MIADKLAHIGKVTSPDELCLELALRDKEEGRTTRRAQVCCKYFQYIKSHINLANASMTVLQM